MEPSKTEIAEESTKNVCQPRLSCLWNCAQLPIPRQTKKKSLSHNTEQMQNSQVLLSHEFCFHHSARPSPRAEKLVEF